MTLSISIGRSGTRRNGATGVLWRIESNIAAEVSPRKGSTPVDISSPAWAALGLRCYCDAQYTGGGREMYQRSESAFERALALAPNLILAAGQLTTARADIGDLAGAYQQAQATLRRPPDSAHAHFTLAYVLRYAGLLTESAQQCDVALRRASRFAYVRAFGFSQ
jgi:tetratricopeptide (TPR) repeat protein